MELLKFSDYEHLLSEEQKRHPRFKGASYARFRLPYLPPGPHLYQAAQQALSEATATQATAAQAPLERIEILKVQAREVKAEEIARSYAVDISIEERARDEEIKQVLYLGCSRNRGGRGCSEKLFGKPKWGWDLVTLPARVKEVHDRVGRSIRAIAELRDEEIKKMKVIVDDGSELTEYTRLSALLTSASSAYLTRTWGVPDISLLMNKQMLQEYKERLTKEEEEDVEREWKKLHPDSSVEEEGEGEETGGVGEAEGVENTGDEGVGDEKESVTDSAEEQDNTSGTETSEGETSTSDDEAREEGYVRAPRGRRTTFADTPTPEPADIDPALLDPALIDPALMGPLPTLASLFADLTDGHSHSIPFSPTSALSFLPALDSGIDAGFMNPGFAGAGAEEVGLPGGGGVEDESGSDDDAEGEFEEDEEDEGAVGGGGGVGWEESGWDADAEDEDEEEEEGGAELWKD